MNATQQNARSEGPVFRIGVLASRLDPDAPAALPSLRDPLRTVLRRIKTALDNVEADEADEDSWEPLRFVIVSALATGVARTAVELALTIGYELRAVFPFPRDQVEAEFADEGARAEYRALLARAVHVDDLPGDADNPEDRAAACAAYEAWMIDEADLLLALVDDPPPDVVREALAAGRPVVRVSTAPPHAAHRLVEGDDGAVGTEDFDAFLTGVSHYGL